MTGKPTADSPIAGCGPRIKGRGLTTARLSSSAASFSIRNPQSAIRNRRSAGFTLLELMIVISILVILAMIAMAQYNKTVLAAREATLREDLFQMRKLIDQYAADKGKLPQTLDDLVTAGYLHEIPIDPMTEQRDWQTEMGDDPGSTDSSQGIVNVRSNSGETSSDGSTRYNEW